MSIDTQLTPGGLPVELNGINVIPDEERKGEPRSLFWPWCAANISVLGVSYGAFLLGFGISFAQAVVAGIIGIVVSFVFVGFISLAGKRGSAPTMILTRGAYGVTGSKLPGALSWILLIGWETALVTLATLASSTVFNELGWGGGNTTKVIAFVVVAVLVVFAGVLGFEVIMRMQTWITIATAVLTVGYIALTVDKIDMTKVTSGQSGTFAAFIGGLVFMMTGFGLGWVNTAADYSRYLPRRMSSRGVVGWTTLGAALAPVVLLLYGLLLCGSDADLSSKIAADPVGALTTVLPTWFLLPFAVVAILGLIGGAVLDIYSSGLALLGLGLKVPRYVAAAVDGAVMTVGTIYLVWFASNFLFPFEGFLITLGVPVAAWCGVFLADTLLRRKPYADAELFNPAGRYGGVGWAAVGLTVVGTLIGWGMVVNTYADWLNWQGYVLNIIGWATKGSDGTWTGDWVYANLGVLAALAIGFVGYLLLGRARVSAQEARSSELAAAQV